MPLFAHRTCSIQANKFNGHSFVSTLYKLNNMIILFIVFNADQIIFKINFQFMLKIYHRWNTPNAMQNTRIFIFQFILYCFCYTQLLIFIEVKCRILIKKFSAMNKIKNTKTNMERLILGIQMILRYSHIFNSVLKWE